MTTSSRRDALRTLAIVVVCELVVACGVEGGTARPLRAARVVTTVVSPVATVTTPEDQFQRTSISMAARRSTLTPDSTLAETQPPPKGSIVAAPSGSPSGNGTLSRPFDLGTALSKRSPVRPGGSVLLRRGVYRGAYTSALEGTSSEPIVVRSYPGEWAVIDGGSHRASTLSIIGPDTWVRDLEVMKSDPKRRSRERGNDATDVSRGEWSGVWVQGARTKLINLVIHDNGDGIGLWRPAVDAEIYGCIIFNNGWKGPDRGWGHGIYVQNREGTKRITNNVIFNNFGYGIHGYDGTPGAYVSNIAIDRVTAFENGSPSGVGYPNIFMGTNSEASDKIEISRSVAYYRSTQWSNVSLGFTTRDNGSISIRDNHFIGGAEVLGLKEWKRPHVTGNSFYGKGAPSTHPLLVDLQTATSRQPGSSTPFVGPPQPDRSWDSNTYLDDDGSAPRPFQLTDGSGSRKLTFDEWRRETGYDDTSSFEARRAMNTKVLVFPNRYDEGRAHIVVLNWSGRSSVDVDLSQAGVKPNRSFQIKDVQNMSGTPVARGRYEGGSVRVPLTGRGTTPPVGDAPVRPEHTPREFGAFVLTP